MAKKENKLTQDKALEILSDGRVHGKRLTRKQKKFFGAIAGGAEPYKAQIGTILTGFHPNLAENLSEVLSAPQKAATQLVTGKYQTPSEAMGIQNGAGAFLTDVVLDPLGLLGIGAGAKAAKASTKTGILSKAYLKNPIARKELRDPNKSFRVAGMDAYDDFVESGVVRSRTPMPMPGMSFAEKMKQRPTAFPSFQKGYADMHYLPEEGGVVFETSLPTFRRGDINPVTGNPVKGRHYAHRVIDTETGNVLYSVPGKDIKVYKGKPHWLMGYQEIKPPKKKQDGGAIEGTMGGLTNKGFNFNPAWGGAWRDGGELTENNWLDKYQDGGNLQPPMAGAVQPAMPMGQRGVFLEPNSPKLPKVGSSSELAMSIGGENGEPAYLIPSMKYGRMQVDPMFEFMRTGEHLGGPFKTWQEADQWERDVRHPYVEKGQSIPTPYKRWGQFAMGGSLPGSVGFMYARTAGAAPSEGPYAKKTLPSAQNGAEMSFYQQGLDWKPKNISRNGGWLDKFDDEVPQAQKGFTSSDLLNILAVDQRERNRQNLYNWTSTGAKQANPNVKVQPYQPSEEYKKAVSKLPKKTKEGPSVKAQDMSREAVRLREEAAANYRREQAIQNSALAQSFGSLTPGGYNPGAGAVGAETFVNLNPITGPGMSASRLTQQAIGENPYGFSSNNPWYMNALGGLGVLGDVLSVGMVPGMKVSDNAPLSSEISSRMTQQVRPPMLPTAQKAAVPLSAATTEVKPATTATAAVPAKTWQMQEMPGLHLKSTMADGAVTKIVEPKTGLVNVEQALGIIGKESGGKEKVEMIRKVLGGDASKKMDYNNFRKIVQDQLIPLDRNFRTSGEGVNSGYGLDKLGYNKVRWTDDAAGVEIVPETRPLENQTLVLSNSDKFGRGSGAHTGAEETLGHIHFMRDAESPDVLTLTQLQSDAFQGTHTVMPKKGAASTKFFESSEFADRFDRQLKSAKETYEDFKYKYENNIPDEQGFKINKSQVDQLKQSYDAALLSSNHLKNLSQKQLLGKNFQERFLQEFVDYAGSRGDVNSVRLPTSETAARIQDYKKVTVPTDELRRLRTNVREASDKYGSSSTEFAEANAAYEKAVTGAEEAYSSEHQTILKMYENQPKLIKKLFGVEPTIVTDSKGNTWYQFDVPKSFKGNKGELKAFKKGGVVKDNMGYWNPENWGKVVEIDSNDITMKGVNQPLIGVSDEGDVKYMEPGKDYKFKGKKVKEYPIGAQGVSVNKADEYPLEKLDNLLNFTNYNKPKAKSGKWLDKYK